MNGDGWKLCRACASLWTSSDASRRFGTYSQTAHRSCTGLYSTFQHLLEHEVIAVERSVVLAQACDRAARMQHGRVIAVAERFPDLGQAHLCQVLRKRHRDLARAGEI